MALDSQGDPPRRPRLPEWMAQVCRCPVCGEVLVTTDSGMVACFWPGHTGLIAPTDFGERVKEAWRAARKLRVVNLTAEAAVKKAMRAVRGATPAAPGRAGGQRASPPATLFAEPSEAAGEGATGLFVPAGTIPPHPVPGGCSRDDGTPQADANADGQG